VIPTIEPALKLFHQWRAARRQPAGEAETGGLTPRRSPLETGGLTPRRSPLVK